MLCQIIDSFLTNYRVSPAFDNLVNKRPQELLLLVEELGKHVWVCDLNLRIDLCLLHFDGRINQCNLGIGDTPWHTAVNPLFVEDDSVYKAAVPDRATLLLLNLDVVQIDNSPVIVLLSNGQDSLHADVREEFLHGTCALSCQCSLGDFCEHLFVDPGPVRVD